ncbi:hypothetical protein FOE78_10125 [Microlunatus elymi]|uniref:Uncharacterized protein n=1 Tax=Microlunatus elymi TaxID=2596828 RepID=A0A516PYG3_9ACTN|nr:hypothetical protein [Microlunatus elymi]QDP96214.1 hypothetical protein FOE78_10125 [Microlunatus elymi]
MSQPTAVTQRRATPPIFAAGLAAVLLLIALTSAGIALYLSHRNPWSQADRITDTERRLIGDFYGAKTGLGTPAHRSSPLPSSITLAEPDVGDKIFRIFFDGEQAASMGQALSDPRIDVEVLDLRPTPDGSVIFRVRTDAWVRSDGEQSGSEFDHSLVVRLSDDGDAMYVVRDLILPDPPETPDPPSPTVRLLPYVLLGVLCVIAVAFGCAAVGRARGTRRAAVAGVAVGAILAGLLATAFVMTSATVVSAETTGRDLCALTIGDSALGGADPYGSGFWGTSCRSVSTAWLVAILTGYAGVVAGAVITVRRLAPRIVSG